MKKLTAEYVFENKFNVVDCVKYFRPNWTDDECFEYAINNTCFPFGIGFIDQLNAQLIK